MLRRHGASIPGAVLSLFVPLPLSNREADHDRVAVISGLATAAIVTAAIATAYGTGEVVDPTLAAAVCLAALAVRLVLHGAVVRRLTSASGARTDVAGLGGVFALAVDARGHMGAWNVKDWAAHFAADFKGEMRKLSENNSDSYKYNSAAFVAGLIDASRSCGTRDKITTLNLRWCKQLGSLPAEIGQLTALQTLDLSWCLQLGSLPAEIDYHFQRDRKW